MRRGLGTPKRVIRKMSQAARTGAARLRPLSNRRRFGRFKGSRLGCSVGRVIDLSGGGVTPAAALIELLKEWNKRAGPIFQELDEPGADLEPLLKRLRRPVGLTGCRFLLREQITQRRGGVLGAVDQRTQLL